jgi:hypothetical protein
MITPDFREIDVLQRKYEKRPAKRRFRRAGATRECGSSIRTL